jgi:hypothetical protein
MEDIAKQRKLTRYVLHLHLPSYALHLHLSFPPQRAPVPSRLPAIGIHHQACCMTMDDGWVYV